MELKQLIRFIQYIYIYKMSPWNFLDKLLFLHVRGFYLKKTSFYSMFSNVATCDSLKA